MFEKALYSCAPVTLMIYHTSYTKKPANAGFFYWFSIYVSTTILT
jgi:hypothetical protein